MALLGGDPLGPQVLVPGREEREQPEGADGRAGEGDGDLPQEPQVADTVEGGGLPQVLGDREEHLADQERAERERQERHHQRLVGVDPVQVLDGLEVAEDDRLGRHGEGRDEDDEPGALEREVEERTYAASTEEMSWPIVIRMETMKELRR